MSQDEWIEAAKAFGVPSVIIWFFVWIAMRLPAGLTHQPDRADVLSEIQKMRAENAEASRSTQDRLASLENTVTDRLARVETTQRHLERRIERIEGK